MSRALRLLPLTLSIALSWTLTGCGAPGIDADDEQADVTEEAQARRKQAEGKLCGGFAGLACQTGLTCVYEANHTDANGICANVAKAASCGGFTGLGCAKTTHCAPRPGLACNPMAGGNCAGICIPDLRP